jgi:hypothetical protein
MRRQLQRAMDNRLLHPPFRARRTLCLFPIDLRVNRLVGALSFQLLDLLEGRSDFGRDVDVREALKLSALRGRASLGGVQRYVAWRDYQKVISLKVISLCPGRVNALNYFKLYRGHQGVG